MNYICVKWKHSHPHDPGLLYSEIDDQRWEKRKIEVFSSGEKRYASPMESFGGAQLGLVPILSLPTISEDPQFEPREISRDEFEKVWNQRK